MNTAFGASSEKKNAAVIAVCNLKGGVTKTTTSISLAAGLAALEKRVLLVDMDPQGDASTGLGLSRIKEVLPTMGTYMQAYIDDVDFDSKSLIRVHTETVSIPSDEMEAVTVSDVHVIETKSIKVLDAQGRLRQQIFSDDADYKEFCKYVNDKSVVDSTQVSVAISYSKGRQKTLYYDSVKEYRAAEKKGRIPKKGDVEKNIPKPIIKDISFDIVAANSDMAAISQLLVLESGSEYILTRFVESVCHDYDYIIIDCPRANDQFTVNALTAADLMLVPTQLELYAVEGLQSLFGTYRKVKRRLNPKLSVAGVVFTKVKNGTDQKEYEKEIRSAFEDKIHIFESMIPELKSIRVTPLSGRSVYSMEDAYLDSGAAAYYRFVREFVSRVEEV